MQTLLFLSLIATALAGSLTCHNSYVQWVSCGNLFPDECISPQIGNGVCQSFPGSNMGLCTSTTFECPAGTECYDYTCRVPPGGTCSTSGTPCSNGYSCIGGTCKCPTSVPDYGQTVCYWPNDALGASMGVDVCNNTGRVCKQTQFDPRSNSFMYGTCMSNDGGNCDTNNDCNSGNCGECKCYPYDWNKLCKHRTAVVNAMQAFEKCLSPYTILPMGPMLESMCNSGAANCKHHLIGADRYSSSELGNKIEAYINNNPTLQNTKSFCSYRERISYLCKLNLNFI